MRIGIANDGERISAWVADEDTFRGVVGEGATAKEATSNLFDKIEGRTIEDYIK